MRLAWLSLTLVLLACGDPRIRAGHAALGAGRYAAAIANFETARPEVAPEEFPAAALARARRALAAQRLRAGDCESGRALVLAAQETSPPVLADHRALYECTAARGASDAELYDDLVRLTDLGDTRVAVRRKLAHLAIELGRDDAAWSHFQVLEKRQVLTWDERKVVMRLLLRLGREQRALPYLEHVVAADPTLALDRLRLADLYEASGRPSEARKVYLRLTEDFRDNPVVFLRLSSFLLRQGDKPGSIRAAETANRIRGISRPPPRDDLRPLPKSKR